MADLKPIPDTETLEFKPKFVERYSRLTDWDTYRRYSLSFLRKSIRVNTLKISVPDLITRLGDRFNLEPIPWCKEGFWIVHKEGRLDIGNTPEHALGYYYVQEAASMIPPVVLNPQPGETVLDMAAAPGSKSTQIAQYLWNTGVLVANDITGDRLAALGVNLQRCGVLNTIVTQMQGQRLAGFQFDKVLLDAPCSGTGTIRKSLKTVQLWNPDMVKRLTHIQSKMLDAAWRVLKPGGTMVYSTCSTEPDEDEGVISAFLARAPDAKLGDIHLAIKHGPAVTEFEGVTYNPDVKKCLRLWPQDNDTEGFFVAKLVKSLT
jgi:NOL1/NOP2/sun family putative RNA methylase